MALADVEWLMAEPGTPEPVAVLADLLRRPPWMAWASCRDRTDVSFFPTRGEDARPAQALCAECPVRGQCLAYAMADQHLVGIWAGTSARERRRMRRQQ